MKYLKHRTFQSKGSIFFYFFIKQPFDCKRRKTIAIWDFENCPVTTLTHHKTVIPNIEKGLKNLGFVGALQIVGVGNRGFLRGDAYLDSLSSVELFHEVKIGVFSVSDCLKFFVWFMNISVKN